MHICGCGVRIIIITGGVAILLGLFGDAGSGISFLFVIVDSRDRFVCVEVIDCLGCGQGPLVGLIDSKVSSYDVCIPLVLLEILFPLLGLCFARPSDYHPFIVPGAEEGFVE